MARGKRYETVYTDDSCVDRTCFQTVIECLKYATTGDQPPNSRGGAFVHDPKMANEKEVKAQVKLRFVAANGQRMLAVRNLSVTVKKTAGLTMKTLESILSLADGNPNGKASNVPMMIGIELTVTCLFIRGRPSPPNVLRLMQKYRIF